MKLVSSSPEGRLLELKLYQSESVQNSPSFIVILKNPISSLKAKGSIDALWHTL